MTKTRQSLSIVPCALCIAFAVVAANADTSASALAAPIAVDSREGAIHTVAPRDIGYSPGWGGVTNVGAYVVIEKVEHAGMFNAATSTVTTCAADAEGTYSFSPAADGAKCVRLVHRVYDAGGTEIGEPLVRDIAFGAISSLGDAVVADSRAESLQEAVAASRRAVSPVMLAYDTAWATNGSPGNVAICAVRLTGEGGAVTGTNAFFSAAASAEGLAPLKRAGSGWMRLVCRIADGSDATLLEYVTGDFLLNTPATTLLLR